MDGVQAFLLVAVVVAIAVIAIRLATQSRKQRNSQVLERRGAGRQAQGVSQPSGSRTDSSLPSSVGVSAPPKRQSELGRTGAAVDSGDTKPHGEPGSPRRGHFVVNFAVADRGAVMYTLDEGKGPRTWQALHTQLITVADLASLDGNNFNQTLDTMIRNAIQRVQELQIPSLYVEDLQVETQRRDGDLWLSAAGEVSFLESEWQRAKLTAQQGEVWHPPHK